MQRKNTQLNHLIMIKMAAKGNLDILYFLTLLHINSDRTVTKTSLYKQWRYINRYRKLSERELISNFEKLFSAYQTEKTKQTNGKVIRKIQECKYHIGSVVSALKIKICYGTKLPVELSKAEIKKYGNLRNLIDFSIISFIVQITKYCKNAVYDHGLIKNIFGLTRSEIKGYFNKIPTYRKIGDVEAKDLELDLNVFTGDLSGYVYQNGFKLESNTGVEFMDFAGVIDRPSMNSIIDRLETKTYSVYQGRWNRRSVDDDGLSESRSYQAKRQIDGYNIGRKRSRASSFLKRIVSVMNLGQYKNCSNIAKNRQIYGGNGVDGDKFVANAMNAYNPQYRQASMSGKLIQNLFIRR